MTQAQEKAVKKFIKHLKAMGAYWERLPEDDMFTSKTNAMIFTFLVMLDGGDTEFLDGFDLIDRETGENISIGYLHEIMNNYDE